MSAAVDTLTNRRASTNGGAAASEPAAAAASTARIHPRASISAIRSRRELTPPVLLKRPSALAACLLSLRAAAPPAVAIFTLYASARIQDVEFTQYFSTLTVLVTVLCILLLQPPRNLVGELIAPRSAVALGLLVRWCLLLAILVAISYATDFRGSDFNTDPGRAVVIWALATPPLLILVTLAIHDISRRLMCTPGNSRRAVFAGYSDTSRYLAERFSTRSELCMSVQGFFDDRSSKRLDAPPQLSLLGSLAELPAYVKLHDIDVIFIALPLKHIRRVHDLLDALGDTTASLYYVPDVFVSDLFEARAGEILGVPVIAMRESPFHGYRGAAKRLMDIVIASAVLVAMLPVLALIALGIRLTSPGPVIFAQRRYGLDGREITIYKFRTMSVTEDSGWFNQARRNDERVTRFGRFLRRWSLDEFPQLINVLQGRMSLVGPRPHAVAHNEAYRLLIKGYMVRHKVPPGITGLAQVKGLRGETRLLRDMQARVRYDLEYVRNWSLLLDLKILLMTVPKVFQSDRAY